MNMYEDLDLSDVLAAARGGNAEAKAALINAYREYLQLLARIHVRPLLQAKYDESDIVQETCVQAIEGFEQFRGENEEQFAAWLRQILANRGASMARRFLSGKRDIRLEQDLRTQFDQSSNNIGRLVSAPLSSPSQRAMRSERTAILASAIEQLRGEQRDVLVMRGLHGMSIPEVAKSLGRSEASTWKLWARGLQALRGMMKDQL